VIAISKFFPMRDFDVMAARFPVPILSSVFLFIFASFIMLGEGGSLKSLLGGETSIRLVFFSVFAFFVFGLVRLMRESKGWSTLRQYGGSVVVYAVLCAYLMFLSTVESLIFTNQVVSVFLLTLCVAPYFRAHSDLSLWVYNRHLWFGVAMAIAAGILFGAGISSVVASATFLFDLSPNSEIYAIVWAFCIMILVPLYALCWVPQKFDYSEQECTTPPQILFMVNWILVPLIMVYMVILYSYFIKIGITREVPKGILSSLILAFGGIGIVTYLNGWPLKISAPPLVRFFYKTFFPALIVTCLAMLYAFYLRIDQYGLTEERYSGVLIGGWMFVMALLFTFRTPRLRTIFIGLIVVFVMANFGGPLSAVRLSEASQLARLQAVLEKNNILVEGTLVLKAHDVSPQDRRVISAGAEYFSRRDTARSSYPSWFKSALAGDSSAYAVANALGIEYISEHDVHKQDEESIPRYITMKGLAKDDTIRISGFDWLMPVQNMLLSNNRPDVFLNTQRFKATYDAGKIFIEYADTYRIESEPVAFDVYELARSTYKQGKKDLYDLKLENTQGNLRVKILIHRLSLDIKDPNELDDKDFPYQIDRINLTFLIDEQM
jgi:hypothetical protein